MINQMMETTNLRLLLPKTLWLEPEDFAEARAVSGSVDSAEPSDDKELQQWRAYINALALFAFEGWMQEKFPEGNVRAIASSMTPTHYPVSYLSVNGFQLCIVATEHVLDEQVSIPTVAVEQAEVRAHCYIVLEVLEEQGEAIARGFLPYDELVAQMSCVVSPSVSECTLLPLSALDAELNHLIAYVRYSHPSKIPLAASLAAASSLQNESASVGQQIARLGQWLQGALDEGWQAVDQLVNPTAHLAWNIRNNAPTVRGGIRGGKLINLGMQLGRYTVALLIAVTPEAEEKLGIRVQVFPTGSNTVLPVQLTVALISSKDRILQAVTAREQDSYIQLRLFKGRPGVQFSLEVSLNDIAVREAFEL
ncbi:MAG: DUF1822 family protein [Phormidesmis sp.]